MAEATPDAGSTGDAGGALIAGLRTEFEQQASAIAGASNSAAGQKQPAIAVNNAIVKSTCARRRWNVLSSP